MIKPSGSWVALPTPFDAQNKIDFGGFKELVDFQKDHGTPYLFLAGSCGEVSMLSIEERYSIVPEMVKYCKDKKIFSFFNATMSSTEATVKMAQYTEAEGADGLIFSAPYYLLPSQAALKEYFLTIMQSVSIPVGIYNNPTRNGVTIEPETIGELADACPNFVVDKEALPSVGHLCEVKQRVGDRVSIMCCDFPKYSILLPTMAMGGQGPANLTGNIIPEEMNEMAKPWDTIEQVENCKNLYFKYYNLMKILYYFSNPVCVKAAVRLLGLPCGMLRKPYQELAGPKLEELKQEMTNLGIFDKYGRK